MGYHYGIFQISLTSANGVPGRAVGDPSLLAEAALGVVAPGRVGVGHPGVGPGVGLGEVPAKTRKTVKKLFRNRLEKMIFVTEKVLWGFYQRK